LPYSLSLVVMLFEADDGDNEFIEAVDETACNTGDRLLLSESSCNADWICFTSIVVTISRNWSSNWNKKLDSMGLLFVGSGEDIFLSWELNRQEKKKVGGIYV
jgi:hypothetical protein